MSESSHMDQHTQPPLVLPPISSILGNPIPPLTITSTPRKPSDHAFAVTPLNKQMRSASLNLPLPTPGNALGSLSGPLGSTLSGSFFQQKHTPANIFSTPQRPSERLPPLVLPPTPQSQPKQIKRGSSAPVVPAVAHPVQRSKSDANPPLEPLDPNTSTLSNTSFQSLGSPTSNAKSNKRKGETFAFISHNQDTFLCSEPSIDNTQLARRKRRKTSPGEAKVLIEEFSRDQTPDRKSRDRIASMLNMTEKEVQIWFQNRRQAVKKQARRNMDEDESLKLNEKFNSSTDSFVSEDDYPPSGVFINDRTADQPKSSGGQMFKFKATAHGLVSPTKSKRKQRPTMKVDPRTPLADITNAPNSRRILSGL